MSQSKETIQISIRVSDLEERLYKLLREHPHGRLITRKIIHNLEPTDRGIEHLFLALSGVEAKSPYKVGDKVYIQYRNASVYRFDRDKMNEAGMLYTKSGSTDVYLLAEVVEIDMRKDYGVKLKYDGLDASGNPITGEYEAPERYIQLKDPVFFGKLLPEKPKPDDDLPF